MKKCKENMTIHSRQSGYVVGSLKNSVMKSVENIENEDVVLNYPEKAFVKVPGLENIRA